ncbi:MAG: pyridoxamine 5'-phosphate oxidase family protein [Chloroflexi bacterium]|nr:pyridoxamine 5'-phosphate oxidase family protein [Chloroflexota bacterium]
MLRELSLQESEALLARQRIGRVAMRDADGTYLIPISYAFAGDSIYAHAPAGKKVRLMRRWPHVAFQVDEIEDAAHWRSVIVKGTYEELQDEESRAKARLLLLRAFSGHHMSVTAGHGQRTTLADAVVFRIRAAEVTGFAENG